MVRRPGRTAIGEHFGRSEAKACVGCVGRFGCRRQPTDGPTDATHIRPSASGLPSFFLRLSKDRWDLFSLRAIFSFLMKRLGTPSVSSGHICPSLSGSGSDRAFFLALFSTCLMTTYSKSLYPQLEPRLSEIEGQEDQRGREDGERK